MGQRIALLYPAVSLVMRRTLHALFGLLLAVLCIATEVQEMDAGQPKQLHAQGDMSAYGKLLSSAEKQASAIGQNEDWARREANAAAKLMGVEAPQAEVMPLAAPAEAGAVNGPVEQEKPPYNEVKAKVKMGEMQAKHKYYNDPNRPHAPTPAPLDGETTAGGAPLNGPTPAPSSELGQSSEDSNPNIMSGTESILKKEESRMKLAADHEIDMANIKRAHEEKALKADWKIIQTRKAKKTAALKKLERQRATDAEAKKKRAEEEHEVAMAESAALKKDLAKLQARQKPVLAKIHEQNSKAAQKKADMASKLAREQAEQKAATRAALEKDLFALQQKQRVAAAKPRTLTPEEKAKAELIDKMGKMGMHSKTLTAELQKP